jgi:DNA replication protein DnaC
MARQTKPNSDVAYLCRALKAPSLAHSFQRLAERARAEGWTHEEFLAACLEREVASRPDHGGENRIRAARFPARKSLAALDEVEGAEVGDGVPAQGALVVEVEVLERSLDLCERMGVDMSSSARQQLGSHYIQLGRPLDALALIRPAIPSCLRTGA